MARKPIPPIDEEQFKVYLDLHHTSHTPIPSGYAARMLGIERKTLQAWVRNKAEVRRIAKRYTKKGEIFFKRCDLHKFMEEKVSYLA